MGIYGTLWEIMVLLLNRLIRQRIIKLENVYIFWVYWSLLIFEKTSDFVSIWYYWEIWGGYLEECIMQWNVLEEIDLSVWYYCGNYWKVMRVLHRAKSWGIDLWEWLERLMGGLEWNILGENEICR